MEIPLARWLMQQIKDRMQTLLWGTVATEMETETLLAHAEGLDRIEAAARKYESEGKPHLAELLRRRAARIDPDAPGGSALPALEHFQSHSTASSGQRSLPALTQESTPAPKRRRGRPRKGDQRPSND